MSKKSFVSIYFTQDKLQIVKLDSSKKKIEKIASVPIPSGIIENYCVTQAEELTQLLRQAWKTQKIGERSVGLVVPEFATYVKTIVLPKIGTEDLDEAVEWQAKEFFTSAGVSEMAMDWKIVGEDEKNTTILAIAIPKENLSGYVDSIAEAGLYPLVVETPALSLVRVSKPGSPARLAVYTEAGDTVLILSQGENILGSSVIGTNDTNMVLSTAYQIVSHYDSASVSDVFVGGSTVTKDMIDGLASIGKVDWLRAEEVAAEPALAQEYMIPLSLQFKDPAEPRSMETINLLPEDWVKRYTRKRFLVRGGTLTLASSLVIWACFFAVWGSYLVMANEARSLEARLVVVSGKQEESAQAAKARKLNDFASSVSSILDASKPPQEVLNNINSARPDGIRINTYRVNYEDGKVNIMGTTESREKVIEFKKALEQVEGFDNVNVPVAGLVGDGQLNFNVSFTIASAGKAKSAPVKLQI